MKPTRRIWLLLVAFLSLGTIVLTHATPVFAGYFVWGTVEKELPPRGSGVTADANGATVQMVNQVTGWSDVTTVQNGLYSFFVPEEGFYTVSVSLNCYNPQQHNVIVGDGQPDDWDFTLILSSLPVSGEIRYPDGTLFDQSVTVAATDLNPTTTSTGAFSLSAWCAWSGTVQAGCGDFTLSPSSIPASNPPVSGLAFTASIQVTAPNASSQWQIGDRETIEWEACSSCNFSSQDLQVSSDGGPWTTIVSGLSGNRRSYNWTVSGSVSSDVRVRVTGYGSDPAIAFGASEAFSVHCFDVSLDSPPDGASYNVGSVITLEASVADACAAIDTYEFSLSRNGGIDWEPLASSSSSSVNWQATQPTSVNCIVKVVATNSYESKTDQNSVPFKIVASGGGSCRNCPPPQQASVSAANRLVSIAPNPFNPRTTVRFELAQSTDAVIEIHDVTGRLVKRAELGMLAPGPRSWTWHGKNQRGESLNSGIYYLTLKAGELREQRSIVLLK